MKPGFDYVFATIGPSQLFAGTLRCCQRGNVKLAKQRGGYANGLVLQLRQAFLSRGIVVNTQKNLEAQKVERFRHEIVGELYCFATSEMKKKIQTFTSRMFTCKIKRERHGVCLKINVIEQRFLTFLSYTINTFTLYKNTSSMKYNCFKFTIFRLQIKFGSKL